VRATVLLWGVLMGCACGEPGVDAPVSAGAAAPAAHEPACAVVLSPAADIAPSVELAAARWSQATGCDVRLGEGGVSVVFDTPILRPDGTEAPGVTEPGGLLVRIDPRHRRRDETVAHELGHVLGAGHTDSMGLMSGRKGRADRIDADSLAAVCEVLSCPAFTPESP
jgi:hypothetical protein